MCAYCSMWFDVVRCGSMVQYSFISFVLIFFSFRFSFKNIDGKLSKPCPSRTIANFCWLQIIFYIPYENKNNAHLEVPNCTVKVQSLRWYSLILQWKKKIAMICDEVKSVRNCVRCSMVQRAHLRLYCMCLMWIAFLFIILYFNKK